MSYGTRSAVRTARKACGKCKRVGWFKPRTTRCRRPKRNRFGRSGYWCHGTLTKVERRPMAKTTDGDTLRAAVAAAAIVDPATAEAAETIRAAASAGLAHAESKLREAMTDLKRATTRMDAWQKKASYYARRAAVTNDAVQAERQKRKART